MDLWPGEHRSLNNSSTAKGKDGKGKVKVKCEPYPVYEPGAVTSVNLHRKENRLEWSFLNAATGSRRRLIARSNVMIFPPTIPLPIKTSSINVPQQTEQSAHFLRLQYSDVEVASDLISEYLTNEIRAESQLQRHNPYAGDTLAVICCNHPRSGLPLAYLAFPTGETRLQLNIIPLSYKRGLGMDIQFSDQSVHKFKTPIEQIVTANVNEVFGIRAPGTAFAVRTMDSVNVMRMVYSSRGGHATHVYRISHSEVGNGRILDVVFSDTEHEQVVLTIVTDCGAVYRCSWQDDITSIRCIKEASASSFAFFRLSPRDAGGSYLLSEKSLRIIESQTESTGQVLLTLPPGPEVFTSVASQPDGFVIVSTTIRILWIDERYLERPVLAIKHGRQPDRNLHLQTLSFADTTLSILTSRRDDLTTVYDVSGGRESLMHINSPPCTLASVQMQESKTRAVVIFRHPAEKDFRIATVFRLLTRGSLHRMDVELSENIQDTDSVLAPTVADLRPEARKFIASDPDPSDLGLLARRNCEEYDFSGAYDVIFSDGDRTEEDRDAVHNLLDVMPIFWQNQEVSVDRTLTTFDIAFASGDEPTMASRADFFKDSILSSVRGYRALVQGRIPREQLVREAPWSRDITPVISQFVPDMSSDTVTLASGLGKYDLTSEEDRPGPSYRREAEAREQLALDLALSSTIYSNGFSDTAERMNDADLLEAVSRATEFMSLKNAEPPPVRFGFFRPVKTKGNTHYRTTDFPNDDVSTLCPLGVRLLLDEWKVGSDPDEYAYEDPYGVGGVPVIKPIARPRLPPVTARLLPEPVRPSVVAGPPMVAVSQPTRPPVNMTSSQPQEMRRGVTGRQAGAMDWQMNASSQNPYSSTQVLPGPHGGRPPPIKKLVKKRVGGF